MTYTIYLTSENLNNSPGAPQPNITMIKFTLIILFINFIIKLNKITIFYYNLCYIVRLFIILSFIYKDTDWFNISAEWGCNTYSISLIALTMWITGLIFICLNFKENPLKLSIFIIILIILIIFFTSIDLILFYLTFEISLIPTFFLIIYWGKNPERLRASFYIMIYILLISFPLLVYIFDIYLYRLTTKFLILTKTIINYELRLWKFLIIYTAFLIKIPIYIFHIWLPKAHVEAPVYGSIILAGVLLKIGRYGLIRLIEILYRTTIKYRYLIIRIGVVGATLTSLTCLTQIDIKRMVAYSSVVHINLILCRLITLYKTRILGRYIIIVAHGLCSSGIFYIVNILYDRSNRRLLFLNKGSLRNIPAITIWWFIFCIANFSFPLSLNFIGEIIILMTILNWNILTLVYLILIRFFRAAYSLYLFSYTYHGSTPYYESRASSPTLKEYIVLIMHLFPLLGLLLNLTIFT